MRAPLVWPNHFPKTPPPNTITWGIGSNMWILKGKHSVYGKKQANPLLFYVLGPHSNALLWLMMIPSPPKLFLSSYCLPGKIHLGTCLPAAWVHHTKPYISCDLVMTACVSHVHSLMHSVNIHSAPRLCQALSYWHEKPTTLLTPDLQYLALLSTSTSFPHACSDSILFLLADPKLLWAWLL